MPKQTIPPILRSKVWFKFFNSSEGKCYCCFGNISLNSYQCGHIISEFNGGKTIAENLVPVCKSCNTSMGVTNLYAYKEKYYSSDDDPGTVGMQFIHERIHDIMQTYKINGSDIDKLKAMKELLNSAIDEKIKELS